MSENESWLYPFSSAHLYMNSVVCSHCHYHNFHDAYRMVILLYISWSLGARKYVNILLLCIFRLVEIESRSYLFLRVDRIVCIFSTFYGVWSKALIIRRKILYLWVQRVLFESWFANNWYLLGMKLHNLVFQWVLFLEARLNRQQWHEHFNCEKNIAHNVFFHQSECMLVLLPFEKTWQMHLIIILDWCLLN